MATGFFTDLTRRDDQGISPTGASPTYNYGNKPTGRNAYPPMGSIVDYTRNKPQSTNIYDNQLYRGQAMAMMPKPTEAQKLLAQPWASGYQTPFPMRSAGESDASYTARVNAWFSKRDQAYPGMATRSAFSNAGGGGGVGGGGRSGNGPSATAGSTPIPLSPEDAYRLREMGIAANTAFGLQASEIDKAEREALARVMQEYRSGARSTRGQMIDVAGAAGESGVGRSPALAGLMQSDFNAELARLASLQNQGIVQTDVEAALQRAQNTAILQEALRRMERERTMLQTAAAMQSRGVAAPEKKKKKKKKSNTSAPTTSEMNEAL